MRPSQFIDPPLQDIAEWFKDVETKIFSFTLSFFGFFYITESKKKKTTHRKLLYNYGEVEKHRICSVLLNTPILIWIVFNHLVLHA